MVDEMEVNLDLIQLSAVEKLSKLKAGALFMQMGTGKTKTALDLCRSKINHFDAIIWIAPASLITDDSYRAEILRWADDMYSLIRFYTVEGISQSDAKYLEMRSFAASNRVFCIVDESITIKNSDAGRTARLLSCVDLFDFRLILNGTPLSKGLIDLYSQINFLSPKILNMTEAQFAANFLQYKKEGWKPWQRWSKPENEEALIEMIRPYIFDAELDIPVALNKINISMRLSEPERVDYHSFKEEYMAKNIGLDYLAVTQKFQSFYTCAVAKIKWLEALKGKHIIFVKFLHEIDALKENFPDVMEYSGREKCNLLDFKNNDSQFLVMTYGTGALGLNLQFCNKIVFFSQTFDWKDKEHGLHRVYRTGQTRNVTIYDLWLDTGLDKLFKTSLDKKTDVVKNVNEFIKNNGLMGL